MFVRKIEMLFHRTVVENLQTEVCAELAQRGYDREAVFAVRLAIEEAIMNAYRHGNKGNTEKKVHFLCEIDDDAVRVEVGDEGPGFEPGMVPDPTNNDNIEAPSGRGILLMREYMTEVEFVHPGNRVRMAYRRT
jgi:serine/threonine-protein kinase RsbW